MVPSSAHRRCNPVACYKPLGPLIETGGTHTSARFFVFVPKMELKHTQFNF